MTESFKFKPVVMYNETGNILEILWSDEAPVAEWINPKLTILHSAIDNKIIGVEIWGIRFFELVGLKLTGIPPLTDEEEKELDETLEKMGIKYKEGSGESKLPGEVLPGQGTT